MIDLNRNYYEILELEPNATRQEIEEAYIKAKDTYSASSPALYSMFSPSEAQELHNLIERAYVILTHPDKRQDYDKSLQDVEGPSMINSDEKEASEEDKKDKVVFNGTTIVKPHDKDPEMEELLENFKECNGSFLQKVRHYRGITLEELSEFSKISKTNILALEGEDFESLPVKVFIRGFVSQITKLLNIDHIKATQLYMAMYDERSQK